MITVALINAYSYTTNINRILVMNTRDQHQVGTRIVVNGFARNQSPWIIREVILKQINGYDPKYMYILNGTVHLIYFNKESCRIAYSKTKELCNAVNTLSVLKSNNVDVANSHEAFFEKFE